MATQDQLDSFYRFATEQIAGVGAEKSVGELYDQWRFENLSPDEIAENVAAVQASIDDMNNGDTGRDAGDVERELREEMKLPPAQ